MFCHNNEQVLDAEVIDQTPTRIEVVFDDTDISVVLKRNNNRVPYIGYVGKLVFETSGNINLQ